jgi:flagellar secretion chaperone FliS
MYATSTTQRSQPFSVANAYARVGVETGAAGADPHHLVQMLFDGLLENIAKARGALRERDITTKGAAIARAVRIVNEGLRTGLNLAEGGRLAADLNELYAYITQRLTYAHAANNDAALDECRKLIEPLRDAWQAIAPSQNNKGKF